jgi:hypothetical protein
MGKRIMHDCRRSSKARGAQKRTQIVTVRAPGPLSPARARAEVRAGARARAVPPLRLRVGLQEPRMALFVGAVALLVAAAVAQPGEGNHSHHHGGHDDPFAGSGCNCSAFCGECSFVLCQTKYRCVPQSCLMNRAAASLTTHARGAANECSINATGKATITQYRMTQFGVVDMRNKNTCVRARPHRSRRSIALVQCPVDRSTPIR